MLSEDEKSEAFFTGKYRTFHMGEKSGQAIQKNKNKTALLFFLLAMLYFTSYMTRLNLSAAKAILVVDLDIFDKGQVGIMGTALFFSYGLGQIISGLLSDKFKPERIVAIGLITTCVCNAVLPFLSNNVALMSIVWGVNGLAQAFFWPPIVRILSKYTDKKGYTRGVWVVSVASYVATLLIFILVPLEINYIRWEAAFWLSALLALVVLAIWLVFYSHFKKTAVEVVEDKEDPAQVANNDVPAAQTGKKRSDIFTVIFSSGALFMFAAVAAQGFFKDGLQDWFPTLLSEGFGMDASFATFSNLLLPLFSIVTMSVSTVLFQKVFKNELTEAILLFAITACLTGAMIPILKFKVSAVLLLVLAAIVNSCLHGVNAMFTCFAPGRYKKVDKVATMSGLFNAYSYMGGAISSYGIGMIAEKQGWTWSLVTWGSVCIVGIIACVVSLKKWNRYIKM